MNTNSINPLLMERLLLTKGKCYLKAQWCSTHTTTKQTLFLNIFLPPFLTLPASCLSVPPSLAFLAQNGCLTNNME